MSQQSEENSHKSAQNFPKKNLKIGNSLKFHNLGLKNVLQQVH